MAIDDVCSPPEELPSDTTLVGSALHGSATEFTSFVSPYRLAVAELSARFGILRDELTGTDRRCPIEHVSSRVKSLDLAGVRVICGVISDTYRVASLLSVQPDVTVLVVEDYIAKPKPNGYKSLHMTIEIPVLLPDRVQQVKVELQLRTRAMDIWASFEHRFSYRDRRLMSPRLVDELAEAADAAHRLDLAIERLHNAV